MFDYYSHVNNLSEKDLVAELDKLQKQLMKCNSASPVYDQIYNMLEMAQEAYGDWVALEQHKNSKDEVLEIGKIDSDVSEINYTHNELLDATVSAYLRKPSDKKRDTQ